MSLLPDEWLFLDAIARGANVEVRVVITLMLRAVIQSKRSTDA